MIRILLAIFSGLIAAFAVFFLGFMIFNGMYPTPMGEISKAEMNIYLSKLPLQAYIIKVCMHCLSCLAGGLVASLVTPKFKYQSGIITLVLVLCVFVYRDTMYEYPSIYVVTDLSVCCILGFAGIMMGGNRKV